MNACSVSLFPKLVDYTGIVIFERLLLPCPILAKPDLTMCVFAAVDPFCFCWSVCCFHATAPVSFRLASVFLEEEKGRICRLRNIKSVLASAKFMGSGGGSSVKQHNNRRRRRPYPDAPHRLVSNLNQRQIAILDTYSQHPAAASLPSLTPNYPPHPFGNITENTLLPESLVRRSSLNKEDTDRGRPKGERSSHRNSIGPSAAWRGRASNEANQSTSLVLEGEERVSLSDHRGEAAASGSETARKIDKGLFFLHDGHGRLQNIQRQKSGAVAHTVQQEDGQANSSGPSAIDLFDQCGLVPSAAIEVEGLVGTTRECQLSRASSIENTGVVDLTGSNTAAFAYPVAPAPAASRPPLGPDGAPSVVRGTRNHKKKILRREVRVRNATSRKQEAAAGQSRPPFAAGNSSAAPRGARQVPPPPSGRGVSVARVSGSISQGAGNTDEPARGTRSGRLNATPADTKPPAKANRVRRRWKVDNESFAAPVPSALQAGLGVAAPSSEQRLASAKERLHKTKGLEELKSEHVKALEILQDISCPSTAAARSAIGDSDCTAEDVAVKAATRGLYERGISGVTRSGKAAVGGPRRPLAAAAGMDIGPADAEIDELSANLPRIGSLAQNALRQLYRKWWMEIAKGGIPPPACSAQDILEVSKFRGVVEAAVNGQQNLNFVTDVGRETALAAKSSVQVAVKENGGENDVPNTAAGAAEDRCHATDTESSRGGAGIQDERPGCDKSIPSAPSCVEQQLALGTAAAPGRARNGAIVEAKNDQNKSTSIESRQPVPVAESQTFEPPGESDLGTAHNMPVTTTPSMHQANAMALASGARSRDHKAPKGDNSDLSCEVAKATRQDAPRLMAQLESDVESVPEDDGVAVEEEEGHHGRIYLPDGRFVSTRRDNLGGKGDEVLDDENVGGGDGVVAEQSVGNKEVVGSEADDASLDYADDDFET